MTFLIHDLEKFSKFPKSRYLKFYLFDTDFQFDHLCLENVVSVIAILWSLSGLLFLYSGASQMAQ